MGTITKWRPSWWTDEVHGSAWDRVKGAMERDWAQTKHDLGLGGYEMNQSLTDTVQQAAATKHLPPMTEANPSKVIRGWNEAEVPYGFGYSAQLHFGAEHPHWDATVEAHLRTEWQRDPNKAGHEWSTVVHLVRGGYEFRERADTWPGGPDRPDGTDAAPRRSV